MSRPVSANDLLRKTNTVGQYYGFTPFSQIAEAARGKKKPPQKNVCDLPTNLVLDSTAQTVASFLKQCQGVDLEPTAKKPIFLWHSNLTPGRAAPKKAIVQFHALGSDRAIADIVIIHALTALIEDLYHETPTLRMNSMGDKETRARYARELGNFFKKRAPEFPEDCISCAKKDALEAAEMAIARAYARDLPSPTDHLSDASRRKFEEVLDLLESTETPYELARDLISRAGAWHETCFELLLGDERVAWGSRYGELARHFFPNATPAAGGVLQIMISDGAKISKPSTPKNRFAFVHIGNEAKLVSLKLAEEFKKAHLPLAQDIGIESLTEQLHIAETRKPSYVLIMGRKEAMEGSVILRNRQTQDERILPIEGLAERLKAVA